MVKRKGYQIIGQTLGILQVGGKGRQESESDSDRMGLAGTSGRGVFEGELSRWEEMAAPVNGHSGDLIFPAIFLYTVLDPAE